MFDYGKIFEEFFSFFFFFSRRDKFLMSESEMKEIKEGKEIGIYKIFFIRLFSRSSNEIFLIIQNCLLLLFLLNSSGLLYSKNSAKFFCTEQSFTSREENPFEEFS